MIQGKDFQFRWVCLLIITLCLLTPDQPAHAHRPGLITGDVRFEGRLEYHNQNPICPYGKFELRDCKNRMSIRIDEMQSGPDLDSMVGQYVRIKGRDMGEECVLVAASEVKSLPDICIAPLQTARSRRKGILQISLEGGFELRDCGNNITLRLTADSHSPNLLPFLGEYVKAGGRMEGPDNNTLRVRSVTLKPNLCSQ
jgi:hypothetical protein